MRTFGMLTLGLALLAFMATGVSADPTAVDSKAVDSKTVDSKTVDSKAVDSKAVDSKAVDSKAVDSKTVDSKTVDSKAVDSKAVDSKADATADDSAKYLLRYQFKPGNTLRWKVAHSNRIRTTISGTTQTAETISKSVKAWRVKSVDDKGTATFAHSVENVQMLQRLTGRKEIAWDSRTNKKPPPGFEHVASSVGVTLSMITLNDRGEVLHRMRKKQLKGTASNEGPITIPLPEKPISLGHSWSVPCPINVPMPGGTITKIKSTQKYKLLRVKTGVATIKMETIFLTPVHNPAVEVQLIQRQPSGTIRFDIDAGRILSQQMDVDKSVYRFQGPASSLHCQSQFTEDFLNEVSEPAVQPASHET